MRTAILSLLLMTLTATAQNDTRFQETHKRYTYGLDLLRGFETLFPSSSNSYGPCQQLQFAEKVIVGIPLPAQGKSLVDKPEPLFFEWYNQCLEQKIASYLDSTRGLVQFTSVPEDNFKKFKIAALRLLGVDVLEKYLPGSAVLCKVDQGCELSWRNLKTHDLFSEPWASLSFEVRSAVVKNLILTFGAPEPVLFDLDVIGPNSTVVSRPRDLNALVIFMTGLPVVLSNGNSATFADAITFHIVNIRNLEGILTH